MKSYLVIRSFSGPQVGTRSEGDVIQLTEDDARGLIAGGLIMPVAEPKRDEVVVETADLPVEKIEKAVIKTRKKKGE